MRAHRQRILQRNCVAEVDDGVDVWHALALGDAGEQCLDGTHELVGVDAEGAERLSVRQDLRLLLDLLALEMGGGRGDTLVEQRVDGGIALAVVNALCHDDTEAGRRQLLENFLLYDEFHSRFPPFVYPPDISGMHRSCGALLHFAVL